MALISEVGRTHKGLRLILLLIGGFVWLGVGLHLFPFWFSFVTSIKPIWETYQIPPSLWPKAATLRPYLVLFNISELPFLGGISTVPGWVYIKNSFILCGGTMALQIPITALAAYSISKLQTPMWGRLLFLFFIGTMIIPYQVSLIPTYFLLRNFPFAFKSIPNIPFTNTPFPHYNFINTYWGVILPACFNGFNFLLLKGYFDTIPDSLINAARLDGASELGIFYRICIPLSKPVLAVVGYFTFSGVWNQFMWPLIVLTKEELKPLPLYLYRLQSFLTTHFPPPPVLQETKDLEQLHMPEMGWNAIMAMAIIQSIPVFIAFIIFREQIMKGIKLRGFK